MPNDFPFFYSKKGFGFSVDVEKAVYILAGISSLIITVREMDDSKSKQNNEQHGFYFDFIPIL